MRQSSGPLFTVFGSQTASQTAPKSSQKRALSQKLGTFDFAAIYYTLSTSDSSKGYPNSIKKDLQNGIGFLTSKYRPRGPKMVPKGTQMAAKMASISILGPSRPPRGPKVASEAPKWDQKGIKMVAKLNQQAAFQARLSPAPVQPAASPTNQQASQQPASQSASQQQVGGRRQWLWIL